MVPLVKPQTTSDIEIQTRRGTAGFVRVSQTRSGQWWFLDGQGRRFFSCGVGSVNRSGRAGGRAARPGAYTAAVDQRHGLEDPKVFVTSVVRRLRAWRINTLGAWTTPEFFDSGLYYTEILEFRKIAPEALIKLSGANVPDVFNPKWAEACEQWAAALCVPRRGSRALLGYFTDHELAWAQEVGPNRAEKGGRLDRCAPARPSLLQICLSLEPSFSAYHAAWEFALAAHGSVKGVSKAWGASFANKEALRQMTLADTALTGEAYRRDHERFSREFARRYFTVCSVAIRQHDPNHLILGCRFASYPGPAILSGCVYPHVDVLSANESGLALDQRLSRYASATSMPVLLSEFSWVHEDFLRRTAAPGEPRGLTSVERMLARGRTALEKAFVHPALVGYGWRHWVDSPDDQPPFGRGLVHLDDSKAREHTELLSDLNGRAMRLRLQAAYA